MKKVSVLFLALILLLTACAENPEPAGTQAGNSSEASEAVSVPESTEKLKEEPVYPVYRPGESKLIWAAEAGRESSVPGPDETLRELMLANEGEEAWFAVSVTCLEYEAIDSKTISEAWQEKNQAGREKSPKTEEYEKLLASEAAKDETYRQALTQYFSSHKPSESLLSKMKSFTAEMLQKGYAGYTEQLQDALLEVSAAEIFLPEGGDGLTLHAFISREGAETLGQKGYAVRARAAAGSPLQPFYEGSVALMEEGDGKDVSVICAADRENMFQGSVFMYGTNGSFPVESDVSSERFRMLSLTPPAPFENFDAFWLYLENGGDLQLRTEYDLLNAAVMQYVDRIIEAHGLSDRISGKRGEVSYEAFLAYCFGEYSVSELVKKITAGFSAERLTREEIEGLSGDADIKHIVCGDTYPIAWCLDGFVKPELASRLAAAADDEQVLVHIYLDPEPYFEFPSREAFDEWAMENLGYNHTDGFRGETEPPNSAEIIDAYLAALNDLYYRPYEKAALAYKEKYSDWESMQNARIVTVYGLDAMLIKKEVQLLAQDAGILYLE